MWGALYGDIIGSVFEWHNVKTERFELFSGASHLTDDTVLNVAVADKLTHCENSHGFPRRREALEAYAARYRMYYARYPDAGYGQMFSQWANNTQVRRQRSYGNGAAMRACPIGYAFARLEDVLKEASLSAMPTHFNREAVRAARAVAGSVYLARSGADKREIKRFAVREAGYDLNRKISDIRKDFVFDSRARYSVPPAIIAFLESESYEDAIRKAISLGGDSDTIACIAGGVAGAYWRRIPKEIADKSRALMDAGLKQTVSTFCQKYGVTEG